MGENNKEKVRFYPIWVSIVLILMLSGCTTYFHYQMIPERTNVDEWKLTVFTQVRSDICRESELTILADSCWWIRIDCDTKHWKNPKTEIVIDTLWLISNIEKSDTIGIVPISSSFMPGRSHNPAYFSFGNFNIPDSVGHRIEVLLNVKILDRQTRKLIEKKVVKLEGIFKKDKVVWLGR